jgi:hypothetical protein
MRKKCLFVFAVDTSGSMLNDNKIEQAKKYLSNTVRQLQSRNRGQYYARVLLFNDNGVKDITKPDLLSDLSILEAENGIDDGFLNLENEVYKLIRLSRKSLNEITIVLITDGDFEEYGKEHPNTNFKYWEDYENLKIYLLKANYTPIIYNPILYLVLLSLIVSLGIFAGIYQFQEQELDSIEHISINPELEKLNTSFDSKLKIEVDLTFDVDFWNPFASPKIIYDCHYQVVSKDISFYEDEEYSFYKSPYALQMAILTKKIIEDKLKEYYTTQTEFRLKITGETDANPILAPYKSYDSTNVKEYFYINQKTRYLAIKKGDFIKDNEVLACLRAYDLSGYLQKTIPIFQNQQKRKITYYANTNANSVNVGGQFRKTSIVIDICNINHNSYDYLIIVLKLLAIILFLMILILLLLLVLRFLGSKLEINAEFNFIKIG